MWPTHGCRLVEIAAMTGVICTYIDQYRTGLKCPKTIEAHQGAHYPHVQGRGRGSWVDARVLKAITKSKSRRMAFLLPVLSEVYTRALRALGMRCGKNRAPSALKCGWCSLPSAGNGIPATVEWGRWLETAAEVRCERAVPMAMQRRQEEWKQSQ